MMMMMMMMNIFRKSWMTTEWDDRSLGRKIKVNNNRDKYPHVNVLMKIIHTSSIMIEYNNNKMITIIIIRRDVFDFLLVFRRHISESMHIWFHIFTTLPLVLTMIVNGRLVRMAIPRWGPAKKGRVLESFMVSLGGKKNKKNMGNNTQQKKPMYGIRFS